MIKVSCVRVRVWVCASACVRASERAHVVCDCPMCECEGDCECVLWVNACARVACREVCVRAV